METINDRVRLVRKDKGLTQQSFGDKIGMKGNSISDIEKGKNSVTEVVIRGICREFNVDEDWLRTGEGDMYIPDDMQYYLHIGRLMKETHPIKRILVDIIDSIQDEDLDRLYKSFKLYEQEFLDTKKE